MNPPMPNPHRPRRPRRWGRHAYLLRAVERRLADLENVDRRAPLPQSFVAELKGLAEAARRPLARAGADLALPAIEPGPVAPGLAFVLLLKLRMVLEQALWPHG